MIEVQTHPGGLAEDKNTNIWLDFYADVYPKPVCPLHTSPGGHSISSLFDKDCSLFLAD